MLKSVGAPISGAHLDRARWHQPLVSVIITHHNYSDFVRDAILSVLDQTYENWELVVVDDASASDHRARLETILSDITDNRVRYRPLPENVGQTQAFFAGFELTGGQFVCLLDPDDRYASTFLEEAVRAHCNNSLFCPVLSTDQFLMNDKGLISGGYDLRTKKHDWERRGHLILIPDRAPRLYFIPAFERGWHWVTTSSLMFRRSALNYLRPHKTPPFKNVADAYLAQGSHLLGGTLFYTKPLVYRMAHDRNDWLSSQLFSSFQDTWHSNAPMQAKEVLEFVKEVLQQNGAPTQVISWRSWKRFQPQNIVAKWKHSIVKRLPFRQTAF